MKIFSKNKKGFTLIELLVVIAIISLLSSVVFASLKSARGKAKDSAIKAEIRELEKLAHLNYSEYGNFSNLQPAGWINVAGMASAPNTDGCWNEFTGGIYASQARSICDRIISLAGTPVGSNGRFGTKNPSDPQKYSFGVLLPFKNTYFCLGSSGRNSDITPPSGEGPITTPPSFWSYPGCFFSP